MPSIALVVVLVVLVVGAGAVATIAGRRRLGDAVLDAPGAPEATDRAEAEPPPRPRAAVLAEAVPAPATISGEVERPRIPRPVLIAASAPVHSSSEALDALDALLAELESTTVRIEGADALDETSVAELEGLAARLEAAAESLGGR